MPNLQSIDGRPISIARLSFALLGINFIVATAILRGLPYILPDQNWIFSTIVDVILMTLLTAPLIWRMLIQPFQGAVFQERKYSAAVLQNATEGFIVLDRTGQIKNCNPSANKMFGYDAGELIGRPIALLIPEFGLDTKENRDLLGLWLGGFKNGHTTVDLLGKRKDGSEFPLELSSNVIHFESADMLIAIVRDATERVQTFEKLTRATEAAETANRAKSQFLANMSHELRTPLNGVLGYAQILQQIHGVTDEQKQYLRSIQRCGDHLLTLINDVLDLARIESGQLEVHFGTCDLPSLLLDVRDVVVPKAIEKSLGFSFDLSPNAPQLIITDPQKLRQVLVNLLANAIKFTESGFVMLRINKSNDDEIQFQVVDSGCGIPADQLNRIFEPFKQLDQHKNTTGGSGLGLTISRRLISALGGTLDVESTVGKGSCFSVKIPLSAVEHSNELRLSDDSISDRRHRTLAPDQKLTLLVADDNETNRDLLVRLLSYAGIQAMEAVNGRDAINKLHKYRMPMILLDMHMPEMDGLAVIKAIRSDPDLRGTAIIVISADVLTKFDEEFTLSTDASMSSEAEIGNIGYDDFIGKPLRVAELLDKIAKHGNVRFVDQADSGEMPVIDVRARLSAAAARDLAVRLRKAAEINSVSELAALAADLQAEPEPACQYGHDIARMADEFDFDGIASLADSLDEVATAGKE